MDKLKANDFGGDRISPNVAQMVTRNFVRPNGKGYQEWARKRAIDYNQFTILPREMV